jgi:hypothetical protein
VPKASAIMATKVNIMRIYFIVFDIGLPFP